MWKLPLSHGPEVPRLGIWGFFELSVGDPAVKNWGISPKTSKSGFGFIQKPRGVAQPDGNQAGAHPEPHPGGLEREQRLLDLQKFGNHCWEQGDASFHPPCTPSP